MTAFATIDDVGVYMNRSLSTGEAAQAQMLLNIATSNIQQETHQTVTLVEDDVAVLRGSFGSVLTLPERPVVDITAVEIDGTALTASTGYTWDGKQKLYRGTWSFNGGSWLRLGSPYLDWGGNQAQVEVTYSHGFSAIPDAVKGVCLAMVARGMSSPGGGVKSETLGPYSVAYDSDAMAVNPAERRILRKALFQ